MSRRLAGAGLMRRPARQGGDDGNEGRPGLSADALTTVDEGSGTQPIVTVDEGSGTQQLERVEES